MFVVGVGNGEWSTHRLDAADIFGALNVDDFGTKLFSSGGSGGSGGLDEVRS